MVTIRTVKGTPEGKVIQTMEVQSDKKWKPLKETIKEKTRKIKTLGEIKEGLMYDISEKSKKTSKKKKARTVAIKRAGGVIERMYKKGRTRQPQRNRQLEIQREKTRQLQLQLRLQSQEANRIAQEQRTHYEQPGEYYPEPNPQERIVEEESPRGYKPSMMRSVFERLRPNPGIMNRIGNLGSLGMGRGQGKKNVRNPNQIGVRHLPGDGSLIKEKLMVAPRLSLLGGNQLRNSGDTLKW